MSAPRELTGGLESDPLLTVNSHLVPAPPPLPPEILPVENNHDLSALAVWDVPRVPRGERRPWFGARLWSGMKHFFTAMINGVGAAKSEKEVTWWGELLEEAPAWVVSVVVHFLIVVILGLCAVGIQKQVIDNMDVDVSSAEDYSDEVFAETLGSQLEQEMPGPLLDEFNPQMDLTYSMSDLPAVDDPLAAPPLSTEEGDEGTSLLSAIAAPSIGLALKGRQTGFKEALLAAYGGTRTTQQSVTDALAWIARQQHRDGTWSLAGPYADGSHQENEVSATAMALLAFLGDGQTHLGDHPYRKNVQRGVKALLKFQKPSGEFSSDQMQNSHRLYTHAQCTIAICELYGMTQDSFLREAAERAVQYCVEIQSPQGGWRYFPGEGSDLSVTGWFVMALQSARMAKLEVPQATLYRIEEFLNSVSGNEGTRYSYMPMQVPTVIMTAEALLCRQYLGWKKLDRRLITSIEYLSENPVDWKNRDVYYWYYATQVLHHMGGNSWVKWNKVMRQVVPEHQVRTGRERGSWDPHNDRWGDMTGRLYTTCLSTYMLEVYYRHLPLYGTNVIAEE